MGDNVIQFPTDKKPKQKDIDEVLDVIRQLYLDGQIQAIVFGAVMATKEEIEAVNEDETLPLHVQSSFLFDEERPEIILTMLNYLAAKLEEKTGYELEEEVEEIELFLEGEDE